MTASPARHRSTSRKPCRPLKTLARPRELIDGSHDADTSTASASVTRWSTRTTGPTRPRTRVSTCTRSGHPRSQARADSTYLCDCRVARTEGAQGRRQAPPEFCPPHAWRLALGLSCPFRLGGVAPAGRPPRPTRRLHSHSAQAPPAQVRKSTSCPHSLRLCCGCRAKWLTSSVCGRS